MPTSTHPVIVWFRRDLRLDDHPALDAACRGGRSVIPVFIESPQAEGDWPPGAASRWWLHHSLAALNRDLHHHGSRLILRTGDPLAELETLLRETGAGAVYWQRRHEPAAAAAEARVRAGLERLGVHACAMEGGLLFEPETIRNRQDGPYRVFTPFWRTCLELAATIGEPLPPPPRLHAPPRWPAAKPLAALGLLPPDDWGQSLLESWTPGAAGAAARLHDFLETALADYAAGRERPDCEGTSRLSPHLHFGELSPRRLWHAVRAWAGHDRRAGLAASAEAFLRQLGWREFAHHLLAHYPATANEPLRPEFAAFPWLDAPQDLHAWQRGQTGIPLVDAGMRQLRATGWMHNRVRMIAASLLVKNLMIDWHAGARWFWETLVDADLANNAFGWQWVAGCGADAAPYFRVFNPLSQGERFDPQGDYIRLWVPELAALPAAWIHRPHQAPPEVLGEAGVVLGRDYPEPVVNLEATRREALIAYARLKAGSKTD